MLKILTNSGMECLLDEYPDGFHVDLLPPCATRDEHGRAFGPSRFLARGATFCVGAPLVMTDVTWRDTGVPLTARWETWPILAIDEVRR